MGCGNSQSLIIHTVFETSYDYKPFTLNVLCNSSQGSYNNVVDFTCKHKYLKLPGVNKRYASFEGYFKVPNEWLSRGEMNFQLECNAKSSSNYNKKHLSRVISINVKDIKYSNHIYLFSPFFHNQSKNINHLGGLNLKRMSDGFIHILLFATDIITKQKSSRNLMKNIQSMVCGYFMHQRTQDMFEQQYSQQRIATLIACYKQMMNNKPSNKHLGQYYLAIALLIGLIIVPEELNEDDLDLLLQVNSQEILNTISQLPPKYFQDLSRSQYTHSLKLIQVGIAYVCAINIKQTHNDWQKLYGVYSKRFDKGLTFLKFIKTSKTNLTNFINDSQKDLLDNKPNSQVEVIVKKMNGEQKTYALELESDIGNFRYRIALNENIDANFVKLMFNNKELATNITVIESIGFKTHDIIHLMILNQQWN